MIFPRTATIRVAALAAAAGACTLIAACGSSPAPGAGATTTVTAQAGSTASTPAASSPAPSATASGTPGCLASGLQARLGSSQGTAGTIYQVVVLTNTSGSACTLYGYPGVSFVTGAGGSQVGAPATKNPAVTVTLVTLAAGGEANLLLGVHDAGAFPSCTLTNVGWLRIYPPGDYGSVYVQYKTQACANAAEKTLSVTPVRPGAGSASY
jgi:hypothetical protein